MCLKTGQGGNKVVHWRGWPSIEKVLNVKSIFLEVVTSELSKYSQILDQNKTKRRIVFDQEDFGSRLLSFVIKYTEIIVIEIQSLFSCNFNRRIMGV